MEGINIKVSLSVKLNSTNDKPCIQHLNVNKEAYDYMTSKECPHFDKPSHWGKLSKKERLDAHMKRICEEFKGTSYNYEVLDD